MAENHLETTRKRRSSWLMSDSIRHSRDFEASIERRNDTPLRKPAKRPEQLFDEIEVEEEER